VRVFDSPFSGSCFLTDTIRRACVCVVCVAVVRETFWPFQFQRGRFRKETGKKITVRVCTRTTWRQRRRPSREITACAGRCAIIIIIIMTKRKERRRAFVDFHARTHARNLRNFVRLQTFRASVRTCARMPVVMFGERTRQDSVTIDSNEYARDGRTEGRVGHIHLSARGRDCRGCFRQKTRWKVTFVACRTHSTGVSSNVGPEWGLEGKRLFSRAVADDYGKDGSRGSRHVSEHNYKNVRVTFERRILSVRKRSVRTRLRGIPFLRLWRHFCL